METSSKNKGFKIKHFWYKSTIEKEDFNKTDFVFYHNLDTKPIEGYKFFSQNTLITKLCGFEEHLNSLSKKVRYDIKQALKGDINCKIFNSSELLFEKNLLRLFYKTYKKMYLSKGLKGKINKKTLKSYIKSNSLMISTAEFNHEILVFHSYITTNNHIRLLHSCSDFRNNENYKKIVSSSNKYLHVFDMDFFFHLGYTEYDWGGVVDFNFESGIDKFKKDLAGNFTQKTFFNSIIPVTKKAKFLFKLLRRH